MRTTTTGAIGIAVTLAMLARCTAGSPSLSPQMPPPLTSMRIATGPVATTAPGTRAPAARVYHVMVGVERGIVLLGGTTASPPAGGEDLFDTWEYRASEGWFETYARETPWADAAAFGTQLGRIIVVLDGGGTSLYDPTANTWTRREGAGGPTTTFGIRAAYDSESDRTILLDESGRTWAHDADANAWTESTATTSPPGRLWHVMAYDKGSDRVILFGGTSRSGADFGDTWAYDLNTDTWQEMSPVTSPPARGYAAMVYDPAADRLVLFGGAALEEPLADTWNYDIDANTWTNLLPATSPSARAWHAMAHDPEAGVVVLFGGGRTRDEATADTWLFDRTSGRWAQRP